MPQVVAKVPPRPIDNHSFGIPDFEPLLNSHHAAQLLDIHHKTPQKLARYREIHGSHVGKMWRFRNLRPECMAGSSRTGELTVEHRRSSLVQLVVIESVNAVSPITSPGD